MPQQSHTVPDWKPSAIQTSWDDLLVDVDSPDAWQAKRSQIKQRFLELICDHAAPPAPDELAVRVEEQIALEEMRIQYISYDCGAGERAYAYLAMPNTPMPTNGFPGVVCLHGTVNWGARQTLGLPPLPGDPDANKGDSLGKDFARQLVRRGYVTISPEHFCAGRRMPDEGPYETAAFYRKHPEWTAVGKYTFESHLACSVLAAHDMVDARRLGVTGHSLGGQGSIWLAAYDDRICCVAPSCCAPTFRENPDPLHWSRDHWYVYFPQLRQQFLVGQRIKCDFHEMMALIAPRPLLERLALNDGDPTCQAHRVMLHLKLRELYRLLDNEPAHAFTVFGDGHAIPSFSQDNMLNWMDRWLKHDGDAYAQ